MSAKKSIFRILSILSIIVIVLAAAPYQATRAAGILYVTPGGIWYVGPNGDDSNNCASPSSPCKSIYIAAQKAVSGDQVRVEKGLFTNRMNEYYLLEVHTSIKLSGGWDAVFSVQKGYSTMDGQNTDAGLYISTGTTVIMDHFVIQNCHKDDYGTAGGIVNNGALVLTDSIITHNASTIDGGGIFNNGTLMVRNSTITFNAASERGGGIWNFGLAHISNSIISHNTAQKGGGVMNQGTFYIFNSTIFTNEASWGGGIYNPLGWGSPIYLSNVTITNNTATTDAGGISSNGYVYPQNIIVAHNTSPTNSVDCSGEMVSQGYNLIGQTSGCNISGDATGNLAGVDPLLLPIFDEKGYYPLSSTSPAIDAGNPTGCTDGQGNLLVADQRGALRNGRCDIGAYEFTVPGPVASLTNVSGSDQSAGLFETFPAPLQVRAFDAIGSPVNGGLISFSAPEIGPSGTFEENDQRSITLSTDEGGFTPALSFRANSYPGSYMVTASNQSATMGIDFHLTNMSKVFLPLISKPDPAQIVDTFPFIDHCGIYMITYNGNNEARVTECINSVRIRLDGQMYFDMRWSVEFLDPNVTSIYKYSDKNNYDMYITDNLGNRYDHVSTGGAAAVLTYFYPSGPTTADGWFMFPAKNPGATLFAFHDDDQGDVIEDLALIH